MPRGGNGEWSTVWRRCLRSIVAGRQGGRDSQQLQQNYFRAFFFSFDSSCILGDISFPIDPWSPLQCGGHWLWYIYRFKAKDRLVVGDSPSQPPFVRVTELSAPLLSRTPPLASLPRFCGLLARSSESAGSSLFGVFNNYPLRGRENNAALR
jgi:hypothetical protein